MERTAIRVAIVDDDDLKRSIAQRLVEEVFGAETEILLLDGKDDTVSDVALSIISYDARLVILDNTIIGLRPDDGSDRVVKGLHIAAVLRDLDFPGVIICFSGSWGELKRVWEQYVGVGEGASVEGLGDLLRLVRSHHFSA